MARNESRYTVNPKEHQWKDLKTADRRINPSNLKDLEQLAKEEWSKITVGRCKKLIYPYRKLFISVIFSNGCATKY